MRQAHGIFFPLRPLRHDALAQLDDIFSTSADYNGYRYYLHALVYYDLKKPDLARSDLATAGKRLPHM